MPIESPADYDEEMYVDGEKIAYGIDEEEVIQYVARCIYNGKEFESEPQPDETEAEHDLMRSIRDERRRMRDAELKKLAAWNAGKPLSGMPA